MPRMRLYPGRPYESPGVVERRRELHRRLLKGEKSEPGKLAREFSTTPKAVRTDLAEVRRHEARVRRERRARRPGRDGLDPEKLGRIFHLRARGVNVNRIAKELGTSSGRVRKVIKDRIEELAAEGNEKRATLLRVPLKDEQRQLLGEWLVKGKSTSEIAKERGETKQNIAQRLQTIEKRATAPLRERMERRLAEALNADYGEKISRALRWSPESGGQVARFDRMRVGGATHKRLAGEFGVAERTVRRYIRRRSEQLRREGNDVRAMMLERPMSPQDWKIVRKLLLEGKSMAQTGREVGKKNSAGPVAGPAAYVSAMMSSIYKRAPPGLKGMMDEWMSKRK